MAYSSAQSLAGEASGLHRRSERLPNPQGLTPPLPSGIAFVAKDYRADLGDSASVSPMSPVRPMRGGCYYMRYTPLQTSPTQPGAIYYLGSLRVQRMGVTLTVSGDLYLYRVGGPAAVAGEPDPADGVPVFPRSAYRYYIRATQVSDSPAIRESFTLSLELFRFNQSSKAWSNDGEFDAELSWTTTPPGYPSEADYLTGPMTDKAGSMTGMVTLGWVSPFLRRATIEIDAVPGGVIPHNNGNGIAWNEVFERVGWKVDVSSGNRDVLEPTGEFWSDREMHEAMIRWRDQRKDLLDYEWHYHLMCVRRLDETERGIMYDASATDLNDTPREGVGIACDWSYPNDPEWGRLQGKRFGDDAATYFRTAIHELGHALGLYHNASDNGFMNTTDTIARRARPERPFPDNILWGFNPDDEKRLRHMPDAWVRPGGIQFGEDYSVSPIAADDMILPADGLRLVVKPLSDLLPLGAPARIEFGLINESSAPIAVPANLTLRGGNVRGKVIDHSGTVRSFHPLVQCVDSQPIVSLAQGDEIRGAVTLIRGPQGALFPGPGMYRVLIEIHWDTGTGKCAISSAADLLVTNPQTATHAQTAYDVLSTPETLLNIAYCSDCAAGKSAIVGAASDATLGPHYAWLAAKQWLHKPAAGDHEKAADLILEKTPLAAEP